MHNEIVYFNPSRSILSLLFYFKLWKEVFMYNEEIKNLECECCKTVIDCNKEGDAIYDYDRDEYSAWCDRCISDSISKYEDEHGM